MDKLLHTSLYRAILKSLNRKATSEKRLQTYFFEFANEITIICNNTDLGAEDIVRKSLEIASSICVYTNDNISVEKL